MKAAKDGSKSDVITSAILRVVQIQAIAQAGMRVADWSDIDTTALFDAINDIALTVETELNELDFKDIWQNALDKKRAARLASAS